MIDATKAFPSGVAFDSLDIDHNVLIIDLPANGRLRLEDAKYLGAIADGMDLAGVSLSVGEFSTFIPTTAYRAFANGEITWREYVAHWSP